MHQWTKCTEELVLGSAGVIIWVIGSHYSGVLEDVSTA
jgi:hypothetical protein